jgi:1-acyl-sn-glycerol-3-phosphate acyltransferase
LPPGTAAALAQALSWAYGDCGGGSAINDELTRIRKQVYGDPRPKEYFDRFHDYARTHDPNWVYELVRLVTSLYAYTLLRARAIAPQNVPEQGAVILAPNHFSFMDHFLLGCHLRRKVRFMGKSQLFRRPLDALFARGGVFPVRRGARDDDAFETAELILGRGGVVGMYCEGGRSRTGELARRPKAGIGRLALESGAPVVPVAIVGSHRIRNWKRLRFPAVSVEYGEPMTFPRELDPGRLRQQEVAETIFAAIREMHDRRKTAQRDRGSKGHGLREEPLHADD